MDTTVTGLFPDRQAASLAAARLVMAGFTDDQVRVVHSNTRDRHEFIDGKTSDAKRAVLLGITFGAVGGTVAGALLATMLGMVQAALLGGLAIAGGGALLGLAVGRSTKSQIQAELENEVDAGSVLVSVTTDDALSARALELLAKEGGASVVSTAASFTAAVLTTTPKA